MSEDTDAISLGQAEDRSRNTPEKPPLPSRWWIVAACLLAGIAIFFQGLSVFGHLGLMKEESRLDTIRNQTAELKEQRKRLEADIADLEIFSDLSDRIGQLQRSVTDLRNEEVRLEKENRFLQDIQSDLRKNISADSTRFKDLREQLRRNGDRIVEQREELEQLATHLGQKKAALLQATDEHEHRTKENAKFTSANEALAHRREELTKSVADEEAKLNGIVDDIRREQDTISNLRSVTETLRVSISRLEAEEVNLKKRIEIAKQDLGDLTTQIAGQTAVIEQKRKELLDLETGLAGKHVEYDAVVQRIARVREDELTLLKHIESLRGVIPPSEVAPPGENNSPPLPAPESVEPNVSAPASEESTPNNRELDEPADNLE